MNPQHMRLHCRFCGSPVSKPLRETPETPTGPGPGLYCWLYRIGREGSASWRRRDGAEMGVLRIKRRDLVGSVLPLEHHPDRIGCCGFPGGTEPNIKCHACGRWILVDIEDCQASAMTAARTAEIELRPAPGKQREAGTSDPLDSRSTPPRARAQREPPEPRPGRTSTEGASAARAAAALS